MAEAAMPVQSEDGIVAMDDNLEDNTQEQRELIARVRADLPALIAAHPKPAGTWPRSLRGAPH